MDIIGCNTSHFVLRPGSAITLAFQRFEVIMIANHCTCCLKFRGLHNVNCDVFLGVSCVSCSAHHFEFACGVGTVTAGWLSWEIGRRFSV